VSSKKSKQRKSTAKETKAINELQIKVVDAFVDAITPYRRKW
jgi:hypothetical protein